MDDEKTQQDADLESHSDSQQVEENASFDDQPDKTVDLNSGGDQPPKVAPLDETIGHDAGPSSSAATPMEAGLRYRVLRPHARGGLGEVFVATDSELNREVALKEIQKHHAHDQVSRSRFVLEAEVTGSLEHPGIVPVYGLGQHQDGRPYYAMRFIRGDSLKEAVDRFYAHSSGGDMTKHDAQASDAGVDEQSSKQPSIETTANAAAPLGDGSQMMEFRKLLGRFIDVCNAIQYAHSRGVLHRDLKPHNIMLGKYGETLVVDWGLARVEGVDDTTGDSDEPALRPSSSSGTAPTQYGKAMGTPAFMPPEQAAGRLDELGPAADVYSLGATLYYLLTGQAAFGHADVGSTLSKVKAGNFPLPRMVNPRAPKALQAICLKAMNTAPHDRYATPRELADDIERYLADEPVVAYQEPLALRTRRWIRKHPKSVSAIAATLLVGLVSTIVVSAVVSGKNKQLADANGRLVIANQAERRAKQTADEKRQEAEAAEQQEARAREQAESVAKYLMRVFRRADPNVDGRTITMAEVLAESAKDLEGRFEDNPTTKAALLDAIGSSYRGLGLYEDAIPILEQARDLRIADLGAEHPDTFETRLHLAEAYQSTWDVNKSLPLLKELHQQVRSRLGKNHPHTLSAINNLGVAYAQAGQMESAFPLLEEALRRRSDLLGEEHADTMNSMSSLAFAYTQLGDYGQAVPLFEKRLQWLRDEKGPDHPSLLGAMQNLALAYQGTGQTNKALPLLKENLDSSTKLLGEDHINTLHAKNNLAKAYTKLQQRSKAIPLYLDSLKRRRATLGDDHPHTLVTMLDLGLAYQAEGDFDSALPLLEEAAAGHETKFGENHVWTLGARNYLAVAYIQGREFEKAVPLCEVTWERCQALLPMNRAEADKAINYLAVAYQSNNEFEKSLPLFEQMLSSARKELGDTHTDTLSSIWNLGVSYLKTDNIEQSLPLLKEFVDGRRQHAKADPTRFAAELTSVAKALMQRNRYQDATPYLRECLALPGMEDSKQISKWNVQSMLGQALAAQGNFAEAKPMLLACAKALREPFEGEDEEARRQHYASTLERLIGMFSAQNETQQAKEWQAELKRFSAAVAQDESP